MFLYYGINLTFFCISALIAFSSVLYSSGIKCPHPLWWSQNFKKLKFNKWSENWLESLNFAVWLIHMENTLLEFDFYIRTRLLHLTH